MKTKLFFLSFIFLCIFLGSKGQIYLSKSTNFSTHAAHEKVTIVQPLIGPIGSTSQYWQQPCSTDIQAFDLEVEVAIQNADGIFEYGVATGNSMKADLDINVGITNGTTSYGVVLLPVTAGTNTLKVTLDANHSHYKFRQAFNNTIIINGNSILYYLNSGYAFDFSITNSVIQGINADDIKITYRIVPKMFSTVPNLNSPLFLSNPSSVQNTTTHKMDFNFDCDAPLTQLQILKLYNTSSNPLFANASIIPSSAYAISVNTADIDWSDAFNVYTSKDNLSLTVAEGSGYYVWRYRKIQAKNSASESDPMNWGAWQTTTAFNGVTTKTVDNALDIADPFIFNYVQFDDDLNWYYTRVLMEQEHPKYPAMVENIIGEKMVFANGLGMVQQSQGFSNDINKIVVSETHQDYAGRTALQTLAAVVEQNNLGYVQGFMGTTFDKNYFDDNSTITNPTPLSGGPLFDYYSNNNPNINVPNAEGFPYTRTVFARNPSNEVLQTSMPGATHAITNNVAASHTNKSLTGSVSETELLRVFGNETPNINSVIKKINIDPNGSRNIAYIDLAGNTIATCLSAPPTPLLEALPLAANSTFTTSVTMNTPDKERDKDKSFLLDTREFAFEGQETVNLSYNLTIKEYKDLCVNLCRSCNYDIAFDIYDEDDLGSAIWSATIKVNPNDYPCESSINKNLVSLDFTVALPNNTFTVTNAPTFVIPDAGRYIFQKRIYTNNNDAAGNNYLATAVSDLETNLKDIYYNPNTPTSAQWTVLDGATTPPSALLLPGGAALPKINMAVLLNKLDAKQLDGPTGAYAMLGVFNTTEAKQVKRILTFSDQTVPEQCDISIPLNLNICPSVDCSNKSAFVDGLLTNFDNALVEIVADYNTYTITSANIPAPSTNAENYFKVYNAYYGLYNVGGTQVETTEPFDHYTSYTKAQLKQVLLNMLEDNIVPYDCSKIDAAWQGAITGLRSFFEKFNAEDIVNDATANNIKFRPDFLNMFFEAAGYHFVSGFEQPGVLSAFSTEGYYAKPYKYFYYPNPLNTARTLDAITAVQANNKFSAAAAVLLYFNSYYNDMLPFGTCTTQLPVHSMLTAPSSSNTSSNFNPNFGQTTLPSALTCDKETDILIAAYAGISYVANSSVQNALTVIDNKDLDAVTNVATGLTAQCYKKCDARRESAAIAISKVSFFDPVLPAEDPNLNSLTYSTGAGPGGVVQTFENHLQDVFVEMFVENCRSKCNLDIVPIVGANGNPAIYQIDPNDIIEYEKAMFWDFDFTKSDFIPGIEDNAVALPQCAIAPGQTWPTPLNPPSLLCNPIALHGIAGAAITQMYNNVSNFKFNLLADRTVGCCKNAPVNSKFPVATYPTQDINPQIPAAYSNTYRYNTDWMGKSLNGLVYRLNKKMYTYKAAGNGSFDVLTPLHGYQSPVHYADNSSNHTPIPVTFYTSQAGTNPICTLANREAPEITIGKKISSTYEIGNYIVERKDGDVMPFHYDMPVSIQIYPKPGVTLAYPAQITYVEVPTTSTSSLTPRMNFESELPSLVFEKKLAHAKDTFKFEFILRVQRDENNPTMNSRKLSNANITAESVATLVSTDPNFIYANASSWDLLLANGSSAGNVGTYSSNRAINDINRKKVSLLIPKFRDFSASATPNMWTTSTTQTPEHFQKFDLSMSSTALTTTPASDAATALNEKVQVVPLYLNYKDASNAQQHEKLYDIGNFKTAMHDWMCMQWHPYEEHPVEEIEEVSCNAQNSLYLAQQLEIGIEDAIAHKTAQFKSEFFNQCEVPAALSDAFKISFSLTYHHYTLYYYDRANNLVRTVPPAGVVVNNAYTRASIPQHTLTTRYVYNSLNQVTEQVTPDAGSAKMWYDSKGRVRFSQSKKQLTAGKCTHTNYDALGRIIGSGEMSYTLSGITNNLDNYAWPGSSFQRNNIEYSTPYPNLTYFCTGLPQRNLLNRVSYTVSDEDGQLGTIIDQVVTAYSYDKNGNVEWLAQRIADLPWQYIKYEYELVSGAVTKVILNECDEDAWYHKYKYNTDKKIIAAYTSNNGSLWEKDASYQYYPHGPLARTTIGTDKVQQLDYAYTIMGWLKGVNHPSLDNSFTANIGETPSMIPDVFSSKLNYFDNDFNRSYNGINSSFNTLDASGYNLTQGMPNLYNGNITGTYTSIYNPAPQILAPKYYAQTYKYDELNRIKEAQYHDGSFGTPAINFNTGNQLKETISYDANGNITFLNRYNQSGVQFDQFSYIYYANTNQLKRVEDEQTSDAVMPTGFDIKSGQGAINYSYDDDGNLKNDYQEGHIITWNLQGKVKQVVDGSKTISYLYDAMGNRVRKTTSNAGIVSQEYYIRDASGNVMENIQRTNTTISNAAYATLTVTERPIYGSSRIGISVKPIVKCVNVLASQLPNDPPFSGYQYYALQHEAYRDNGSKRYEIADHLGNVRSIFTDVLVTTATVEDVITFSEHRAETKAMYNYFAFGSPKPNTFDASGAVVSYDNWYEDDGYRFGFNGQEKVDEIAGVGNHNTALFWEYDTRLGRRWNIDPKSNVSISSYATFANNPIFITDILGDSGTVFIDYSNAGANAPWKNLTNGESESSWKARYEGQVKAIMEQNGMKDVNINVVTSMPKDMKSTDQYITWQDFSVSNDPNVKELRDLNGASNMERSGGFTRRSQPNVSYVNSGYRLNYYPTSGYRNNFVYNWAAVSTHEVMHGYFNKIFKSFSVNKLIVGFDNTGHINGSQNLLQGGNPPVENEQFKIINNKVIYNYSQINAGQLLPLPHRTALSNWFNNNGSFNYNGRFINPN